MSWSSQVCVWIMDGAEGCDEWMVEYLLLNLVLLSSLFVCAKGRVHLWPFWIQSHTLTQITAVKRWANLHLLLVLLLRFSHPRFFSPISPGWISDLRRPVWWPLVPLSPFWFDIQPMLPPHTHSTKILLCYSTYLVTGPNPRGFLTGPEFMTPAVNSY